MICLCFEWIYECMKYFFNVLNASMNAWLYADAWNFDSHEIFYFILFIIFLFFLCLKILICYLTPLFKPNIFIESLNSLIELWTFNLEKHSQILTLDTKMLIQSVLTFWCVCAGMGGWTNTWWWRVKLRISNGIAPSMGVTLF